MANTFGTLFRMTTFGESHGPAMGCVIDGCPAGVGFDLDLLRRALSRRRPGQALTTARNETDEPEILSGLFEGRTLGTPIAILVRNRDQHSGDYDALRDLYRPSHADFTYSAKYGHRDHRGGGRSSARETLTRVAAGSVARMMLAERSSIVVRAAVVGLGPIEASGDLGDMSEEGIYASPVRTMAPEAKEMMALLERRREEGDSVGGVVGLRIDGLPAGIGEPIYDKLSARLAGAMLSINGSTGVEIGSGFAAATRRGSENNDQFAGERDDRLTVTNNSGGIQGGISNGMPVTLRVAFKPPSSIALEQRHATAGGETLEHAITGRHDPSIVVRAVPVVEAMAWLVLADLWLMAAASRPEG